MIKTLLLILCISLPLFTFGQLQVGRDKEAEVLIGNNEVKALYSNRGESFKSVLQKDFNQVYDTSFVPVFEKDVWIQFTVVNMDTFSDDYYVYSKDAYFDVFVQTDTGWQIQRNGYLQPLKERAYKENNFFLPIHLHPFKPIQVYIRLQTSNYVRSNQFPILCNKMLFYEVRVQEAAYNQTGTTFTLIYLSGLIMISFFILILYISIRKPVYIYYLFYLLFQILYSLLIFARTPLKFMNIALYFPVVGYAIVEGVQFFFIGFYIFFILKLLEVNKYDKRLSHVMRWVGWICFAYAIFSIGHNSLFPDPYNIGLMFAIVRSIILPVNLLLIIWVIIKVKHPLIAYFVIGNIFFFIGSALSVYVSFSGIYKDPDSVFNFGNSLNTIFQMGLLGEVLCFAFAIAHHVRLIQVEKEASSKAYIAQLNENQSIQENMNIELDKIVKEKTTELIAVYSDIEKQREKEIKHEFTQKIKGMEMLALRAQMNPHFLFNSMNAIKHLIMTERSEDAMNYLDDFSSLLRGVLQNSKRETITVEDELEILELYLSLEKGRLGGDLNFSISVDNKDILSQYPIPALLLQPFVENAIWHGLKPSKETDKWLKIHFSTQENLIITISDNGIGRKESQATEGVKKQLHKSYGIQITQERLALFNHFNDLKISLQVNDLDPSQIETGTLVTFTYSN